MKAYRILIGITIALSASFLFSGAAHDLATGFPRAIGYVARFWPIDWASIPSLLPPTISTLTMSLYGTTLALATALPLSLLASRGLVSNFLVYLISRTWAAILRASPIVVLGIVFIAAVGLGPTAGIMGIWLHTVGVFVKYFSETFEGTNWEIMEAAFIDGANLWQAYTLVLIPMEANAVLSFLLYYFEANFRQATFLAMVGAGGIGIELSGALGRFNYGRAGAIIVLILATALILDLSSSIIRSNL